MQGKKPIVDLLNRVLVNELTAINQYFMHAKMCQNWGFKRLGEVTRKESIDEMKHAERLMDRILFLEGLPNLQDLHKINIGETVEEQLKLDLQLEMSALKLLHEGIDLTRREGDDVSKALLQDILVAEEEHIDWLETQLELIRQVGLQNYLQSQI